jgi:hypothetical protein
MISVLGRAYWRILLVNGAASWEIFPRRGSELLAQRCPEMDRRYKCSPLMVSAD